MPNKTSAKDTTKPEAPAETAAKKERPQRSATLNGRSWPVLRSYYNPKQNCVVDVLEVTKLVPQKGDSPPKEVKIQKHTRCRDERIQKAHCKPENIVEVPTMLDLELTEGTDNE